MYSIVREVQVSAVLELPYSATGSTKSSITMEICSELDSTSAPIFCKQGCQASRSDRDRLSEHLSGQIRVSGLSS